MTVVVPQRKTPAPGRHTRLLGYEVALGLALLALVIARRIRFRGVVHRARRPRPVALVARSSEPTPSMPVVADGPTFRLYLAAGDRTEDLVEALIDLCPAGVR